jgi:hypothetical protein
MALTGSTRLCGAVLGRAPVVNLRDSALVGAIWQVRDNLAFDVGLRHALVNGRPVNELRAGVTFGFPLNPGRPTSEPTSAMQLGRR